MHLRHKDGSLIACDHRLRQFSTVEPSGVKSFLESNGTSCFADPSDYAHKSSYIRVARSNLAYMKHMYIMVTSLINNLLTPFLKLPSRKSTLRAETGVHAVEKKPDRNIGEHWILNGAIEMLVAG